MLTVWKKYQKADKEDGSPGLWIIIVHLRGLAPKGCLAAPESAQCSDGNGAQFSQAAPSSPLRPVTTAYPWHYQMEMVGKGIGTIRRDVHPFPDTVARHPALPATRNAFCAQPHYGIDLFRGAWYYRRFKSPLLSSSLRSPQTALSLIPPAVKHLAHPRHTLRLKS
jgi:hypothetical protein